jgi:hypothetical protein
MVVQVAEACSAGCGVRVSGELDTDSREFVHHFVLPKGAEQVLRPPPTEVERVRLVTFGPSLRTWSVDCPVCRQAILIMQRNI